MITLTTSMTHITTRRNMLPLAQSWEKTWVRKIKIGCARQLFDGRTDTHCDSLSSWAKSFYVGPWFSLLRIEFVHHCLILSIHFTVATNSSPTFLQEANCTFFVSLHTLTLNVGLTLFLPHFLAQFSLLADWQAAIRWAAGQARPGPPFIIQLSTDKYLRSSPSHLLQCFKFRSITPLFMPDCPKDHSKTTILIWEEWL